MRSNLEERLAKSWEVNAGAWIHAVRGELISSRSQATDGAILKALLEEGPRRVLDLGCGEGWLARSLAAHDIDVVGVDASHALIASARQKGRGEFHVCSFEELAEQPDLVGSGFELAVSNFAFLQQNLTPVLRAVHSILVPSGVLVIQTVHPWTAGSDYYEDRWMEETFENISGEFAEPMPWYYRTLSSWTTVLAQSGYRIREMREPTASGSTTPLSLIIMAPSVL